MAVGEAGDGAEVVGVETEACVHPSRRVKDTARDAVSFALTEPHLSPDGNMSFMLNSTLAQRDRLFGMALTDPIKSEALW